MYKKRGRMRQFIKYVWNGEEILPRGVYKMIFRQSMIQYFQRTNGIKKKYEYGEVRHIQHQYLNKEILYASNDLYIQNFHITNQKYNCEHVWCKSYSKLNKILSIDLHNIFLADKKKNEERGVQHYGKNGFIPDKKSKGKISRTISYIHLQYPNTFEHYHPKMIKIEDIIRWNFKYPPTYFELYRNEFIYHYQGNYNPFIRYPILFYLFYKDEWNFPELLKELKKTTITVIKSSIIRYTHIL